MAESTYRFLSISIRSYWMEILFVLFPVATTLYIMALANPFQMLIPGAVSDTQLSRATLLTMLSINITLIFILVELTTLYLLWFGGRSRKK